MIGHIQDFSSDNVIKISALFLVLLGFLLQNVLTPRQKLAISQELDFRKQGFPAFSPETDGNITPSRDVGKEAPRSQSRNQNSFTFTKPQDNLKRYNKLISFIV